MSERMCARVVKDGLIKDKQVVVPVINSILQSACCTAQEVHKYACDLRTNIILNFVTSVNRFSLGTSV